jgi:hypothetical protein
MSGGTVTGTVQYRVALDAPKGRGKPSAERVAGPDDADVVVSVAAAAVTAAGFDPAVAFMQGELKAAGHTGVLFAAFASGEAARTLAALVTTG